MQSVKDQFIDRFLSLEERFQNICHIGAVSLVGQHDFPPEFSKYAVLSSDPTSSSPDAVLEHSAIRCFFTLKTFDDAPSEWIRGISTFYPDRNAMNGSLGSQADRDFIRKNRYGVPVGAKSINDLLDLYPRCCWFIDAEGSDYEIVRQILRRNNSQLILFEAALMDPMQLLELRALATSLNFGIRSDKEDTLFFRPKDVTVVPYV